MHTILICAVYVSFKDFTLLFLYFFIIQSVRKCFDAALFLQSVYLKNLNYIHIIFYILHFNFQTPAYEERTNFLPTLVKEHLTFNIELNDSDVRTQIKTELGMVTNQFSFISNYIDLIYYHRLRLGLHQCAIKAETVYMYIIFIFAFIYS